ncbi:13313_t:CDS:1, partial [Racocetra persica]
VRLGSNLGYAKPNPELKYYVFLSTILYIVLCDMELNLVEILNLDHYVST